MEHDVQKCFQIETPATLEWIVQFQFLTSKYVEKSTISQLNATFGELLAGANIIFLIFTKTAYLL